MSPNPKPDPYPNQTLTLTLALTLTLVAEKWHFPNNGFWLAVLDHMTQILAYDWLVTNYSKCCHRWRHTWRKSRSLISCTQSILVTWPGSRLWLVDGNVNIMTSSITGLWLANRMTKYTRDVQCAPTDSLYTMLLIARGMRARKKVYTMHNAANRGMRIRTMLNYMRGYYTLIYFHIHNICARVCTLMDKIFAYPQYVCVCVCVCAATM